jgi:hypothetical protein
VSLFRSDVCTTADFASDYDVFLSPLKDFKTAVVAAGLADKVVYLDRGDAFKFAVKVKSEPESK